MKKWIVVALAGALTLMIAALAIAQSSRTANVEVRVWEDVNDPLSNYISARPEGGSWRTLGTIALPLDDGISSSGRFRYGDITLAVPLPDATARQTPSASSQTAQPDIEITNLRCEAQNVGRYFSNYNRTIRGTIRNISDAPLSWINVQASLFQNETGIATRQDSNYDLLVPGSGWNFEINFYTERGNECRIWKVTYQKTIADPEGKELDDIHLRDSFCGERRYGGQETVYFTVKNTSTAIISGIDVQASVYGASRDDVDSDSSSGVPSLAPEDETVVTIGFSDFEGEARRCTLDTLSYRKEISRSEAVPYE